MKHEVREFVRRVHARARRRALLHGEEGAEADQGYRTAALAQTTDFALSGRHPRYCVTPLTPRGHQLLATKFRYEPHWWTGALVLEASAVVAFAEHLPRYGLRFASPD
jgi:hypothetical protein